MEKNEQCKSKYCIETTGVSRNKSVVPNCRLECRCPDMCLCDHVHLGLCHCVNGLMVVLSGVLLLTGAESADDC